MPIESILQDNKGICERYTYSRQNPSKHCPPTFNRHEKQYADCYQWQQDEEHPNQQDPLITQRPSFQEALNSNANLVIPLSRSLLFMIRCW